MWSSSLASSDLKNQQRGKASSADQRKQQQQHFEQPSNQSEKGDLVNHKGHSTVASYISNKENVNQQAASVGSISSAAASSMPTSSDNKTKSKSSTSNTCNSSSTVTHNQQKKSQPNASIASGQPSKRPLEDSIEQPLRKIHVSISRAWEREFQSLVAFKNKFGHCNVPYRYEGDSALGAWVARQRKEKNNLTPEQIQKLKALDFTWVSSQERAWMDKFESLKAYFRRFGNSCVPTSYADDPALGEWTAKQRQKYSQGRLSPERQELLDTVGFVYRINKQVSRKSTTREDKKWWGQLERLTHFLLEHGHTLVPFQYADKSLGRWVNEQRCQNTRGLLRQDRKDILDNIGFVWRVTSRKGELKLEDDSDDIAVWCYRFRELVEYKKNHGAFPSAGSSDADSSVREWAEEQKELIVSGKMDEMRAQRFATIGFCQDGEAEMWEMNYQELLKKGFNSIYSLDDACLSHWVICQRYLHKKGMLAKERKIKFFEVQGFSWDSSPLNLPQPEPKHVAKEKHRRQNSQTNKTKKQKANIEASQTTTMESEGESSGGLGLLAIVSQSHHHSSA